MGLHQQAAVTGDGLAGRATEVAAAATRYQAFREVEAEHLALMAKRDLAVEWNPELRQIVFKAGDYVRNARDARMRFRRHIRAAVTELRVAGKPLPAVLRQTRSLIHRLEASGALHHDGGWLEAEVLEWAIEEYDNVS